MAIYINRNGQQSGPFEDQSIVDQLRSGQLSSDDLGIRSGESQWQRLGALFPHAAPVATQFAAPPPVPVNTPAPIADAAPVQYEAIYRGTTAQKVFFGFCLLVAVVALVGSAVYFYSLMGSSGNLEADLGRMSFRILARNMVGGSLVGACCALIAFLLTFKRKLIRSNGPRVALRVIFILILFLGMGSLAGGAMTYATYHAPYKSPTTAEPNELLKALADGAESVGPFETAAILVPMGAGLFLLGLSGVLMTKKLRTE